MHTSSQKFRHLPLSTTSFSVLIIVAERCVFLTADGERKTYTIKQAREKFGHYAHPIALCCKAQVQRHLHAELPNTLDILELWAFVRPAKLVVPTLTGIAKGLNLDIPVSDDEKILTLVKSIDILLKTFSQQKRDINMIRILSSMYKAGWHWSPLLFAHLGINPDGYKDMPITAGFDVHKRRKKWPQKNTQSTHSTSQKPSNNTQKSFFVTIEHMERRFKKILPPKAKSRTEQWEFSRTIAKIFRDKKDDEYTPVVLAQAETGVGKTLGYLVPATIWAENTQSPVWISTYTKNLQHQIYRELSHIYTNTQKLYEKVVLCKGRENYVCLSRFQALVSSMPAVPTLAIPLGLLCRWLEHTLDGDIQGIDFPAWLGSIVDKDNKILSSLVIKREFGENHRQCMYKDTCFVDLPMKKAHNADIVVTNHTFLLQHISMSMLPKDMLRHVIFDEGHHIFDVADAVFSDTLCAQESCRLRMFILRQNTGAGVAKRKDDDLSSFLHNIFGKNQTVDTCIQKIQAVAYSLPDIHWQERIRKGNIHTLGESFFYHIKRSVYASSTCAQANEYTVEQKVQEVNEDILNISKQWALHLGSMVKPVETLLSLCQNTLKIRWETLSNAEKKMLHAAIRILESGLLRFALTWSKMLESMGKDGEKGTLDIFFIKRMHGQDINWGMRRHLISPMAKFVKTVLKPLEGCVITSASLTDSADRQSNGETDHWQWAKSRLGTAYLPTPPLHSYTASSFDYANQAKVLTISGIQYQNIKDVAHVYSRLFTASKGGGLGLFTSIEHSLRVFEIVRPLLASQGIEVYAQHDSNMNLATLVDIFREDTNSCLLGTDALRDGLDVVGESLRLIILNRIPWQRTNIVHHTRKQYFMQQAYCQRQNTHMGAERAHKDLYTPSLVRAKLKQAFGRLIRSEKDRGIFIVLQSLPTYLHSAFPKTVDICKTDVEGACTILQSFQKNM